MALDPLLAHRDKHAARLQQATQTLQPRPATLSAHNLVPASRRAMTLPDPGPRPASQPPAGTPTRAALCTQSTMPDATHPKTVRIAPIALGLPIHNVKNPAPPASGARCSVSITKRGASPAHAIRAGPPQPHGRGGGDRARTGDPLRAKQVLSQLSYAPERVAAPAPGGGPGRI